MLSSMKLTNEVFLGGGFGIFGNLQGMRKATR